MAPTLELAFRRQRLNNVNRTIIRHSQRRVIANIRRLTHPKHRIELKYPNENEIGSKTETRRIPICEDQQGKKPSISSHCTPLDFVGRRRQELLSNKHCKRAHGIRKEGRILGGYLNFILVEEGRRASFHFALSLFELPTMY
jgi:hypothetical protein